MDILIGFNFHGIKDMPWTLYEVVVVRLLTVTFCYKSIQIQYK